MTNEMTVRGENAGTLHFGQLDVSKSQLATGSQLYQAQPIDVRSTMHIQQWSNERGA